MSRIYKHESLLNHLSNINLFQSNIPKMTNNESIIFKAFNNIYHEIVNLYVEYGAKVLIVFFSKKNTEEKLKI